MQTFKNGGITQKLRKSYTYASQYALILLFLKMSLGFGKIREHLRCVLNHACLVIRFSSKP